MNKSSSGQHGGINVGPVGRDAKFIAKGDIVGGNKATTIYRGFADDGKKQQFQQEIEQLRVTLGALKTELESHHELSAGQKEEIVKEIVHQSRAFTRVSDITTTLPVGNAADSDIAAHVETVLQSANGLVGRMQGLAGKASVLAGTIAAFATKFGPMVAGARRLFGLP